jgi:hypothetical protein
MKHTPSCQPPERAPLLRIHREGEPVAAMNCEEEREQRQQETAAEEFWAGRNHTMRQSARVAA